MATFQDLQTRVQRRVIDLPQAVRDEVPDLINQAIRSIQKKHDFKVMEEELTLVTVIGSQTLGNVPELWKSLRDQAYRTEALGRVFPLSLSNTSRAPREVWATEDEGAPTVLWETSPLSVEGERQFMVWPIPDGNSDWDDGEYRVTIPYWRYVPHLTLPTSTNWFTNNAEMYIINQATAEAFALDWDEERMAVWAQKAAAEQHEVISTDKKFRLAGVDTMVPHWRGARTPNLRF